MLLLETYLEELKETVAGIPQAVTAESISGTVEDAVKELSAMATGNENLKELIPLITQSLTSVDTETRILVPQEEEILKMRNEINELKSIMMEIRKMLDQQVNQPVVHGWLEGN